MLAALIFLCTFLLIVSLIGIVAFLLVVIFCLEVFIHFLNLFLSAKKAGNSRKTGIGVLTNIKFWRQRQTLYSIVLIAQKERFIPD